MDFLSVYIEYLNKLESISIEHDEITDTDVRERLHEVINWYFIWGKQLDSSFPEKYAMFSKKGDAKVATATRSFVEKALKIVENIPIGQARNDLIEDSNAQTEKGNHYWVFLGSTDEVISAEYPTSDNLYGDYD